MKEPTSELKSKTRESLHNPFAFLKKKTQYLERGRKYPNLIYPAHNDSVQEGFEHLFVARADLRLTGVERQNSMSSSTMFHATFGPDSIHKKRRHDNCDEQYYVISGHGLAGAGLDRFEVFPGHYHFIPKGVEHWLANMSDTEDLIAPGWYIGVGGLDESGFQYKGPVTEETSSSARERFRAFFHPVI